MQKPVAISTNNLEAFWMPFTANRQFKKEPRLLVRAEGMNYWSHDGRKVLDGTSGLWCVNAGHGRPEIAEAVKAQLLELDYAPAFQMGHPEGVRAGLAPDRDRAAGPRPCVLHQFRVGVGRHGVEDRARLPPREGRRQPHPPDRARARLSRRQFRRHLGRRHRLEPQAFRSAPCRRRSHPPHPRSEAQRLHARRAGAWCGACGRSGAPRRTP